ncbi:MAG: TIGR03663 family protein [Acidobacteria bacterium]|nr:TIGR03663 family protein [Acidobacteriota bacterium]
MWEGSTSRRRLLAWAALLALSLGLHLWRLGERSFHHDEAIHASLSFNLARQGEYRYDPTYHGPLLYALTAAGFTVLGDSDFTARLPIALAGVLLLGVAWSLRREIGEAAAWWTGLLVTLSPVFLYYGRFLRMDVLAVLMVTAALVAFLRLVHGASRSWVWLGVWAGLAFATKETAYVTVVLLGLTTVVVAARKGLVEPASEGGRWLLEHRWGVAASLLAAVAVAVPLYTVLFRWPSDALFPIKAVSYWWHQHSIERVRGPWWYHLPRLVQYELLPLAAAAVLMLRRRKRRSLEIFLFTFGALSIAMYCYLGEKVPWLEVHQVWPFIPLAGIELAEVFGRPRRWPRMVATAALAITAATAVTAAFVTDEISPSLPRVESLVYVQTCPEVAALAREGERLGKGGGTVAAVSGEAAWPLTWYWRHLDIWWDLPAPGMRPPLVVCDPGQEPEVRSRLGPAYSARRIPLRAWWVPAGTHPTLRDILRYLVTRKPWSAIGSTDVVVLERGAAPAAAVRDVAVPEALKDRLGVVSARVIGEGYLRSPRGLAVSTARMAVADTGLSRIVFFDRSGAPLGISLSAQLKEPEDVAWLPGGVLAVADTWNHRVLVADPGSGKVRPLPQPDGGWYGPRSVAASPAGTLAVSDTGNKRIVMIEPGGRRLWTIGEPGSGPGELDEPVGLAWIGRRRIVVCDTGNHRLQVLSPRGRVERIVPLPGAWPNLYSRPQVAVLGPRRWVASDTPNRALWVVQNGRPERVDLGELGITPSGVAWSDPVLFVADTQGRVWALRLAPRPGNAAATRPASPAP